MKKLAFVSLVMAILLIFAGCAAEPPIADGTYVAYSVNEDEFVCPYFHIDTQKMTFMHSASPLMSFAMFGDIEFEGDKLIAEPKGEDGILVFDIADGNLVYNAEESTAAPLVWMDSAPVKDGEIFTLAEQY